MRSWKKILCPVDFSAPSRHAVTVALELADRFDAEVTLLHVVPDPAYPAIEGLIAIETSLETVLGEGRQLLEAVRREVDPRHERAIVTMVKPGAPAPVIIREAQAGDYDLVVVGTHGRTGWRHVLLGSVAELVVRRASCAVLSVHRPSDDAVDAVAWPVSEQPAAV
jgi:nucleotide-binding universal stress UspA family protein